MAASGSWAMPSRKPRLISALPWSCGSSQRRAMAETTVIIDGGATNKSFVLDLLDQPEVIDATADTGWIDRVRAEGRLVSRKHSAIALAAAAIEAYEDEEEVSRQQLLATAHGGQPQVQHDTGRPLDLKLRGASYRVTVARVGRKRYRVGVSAGGSGAALGSTNSVGVSAGGSAVVLACGPL